MPCFGKPIIMSLPPMEESPFMSFGSLTMISSQITATMVPHTGKCCLQTSVLHFQCIFCYTRCMAESSPQASVFSPLIPESHKNFRNWLDAASVRLTFICLAPSIFWQMLGGEIIRKWLEFVSCTSSCCFSEHMLLSLMVSWTFYLEYKGILKC